MESRGILGRLVGPCADFVDATRNGRKYSEDLWENVFNNNIMQEKLKNKVCYGELGHPADREEIDMEKVAVALAEEPKKGKDGKLYAVFDILSTPNGKLLKALCDYGSVLGISSRGTGDLITDYDGNESVDPDTYNCECFDVVIVPAVESARLQYVTESLDSKNNLNRAINEALENSNDEEKKVMKETLDELNIDYKTAPTEVDHIDGIQESKEAENNGSDMSKELLEALKANEDFRKQVAELQEKLSVSYTKEAELVEKISKYQSTVKGLSSKACMVEGLMNSKSSLEKSVEEKDKLLKSKEEEISHLKEDLSEATARYRGALVESKKSERELTNLKESLNSEKSKSLSESKEKDKLCEELQQKIDDLQGNIEIKTKEFNAKIANSNKMVEKYKNIAQTAVNRYIESQALRIGVKAKDIKNKLGNSYTFDDVDSVCEDLQRYKINVSKLPFSIGEETRVRVKKAEEPIRPSNLSDTVDESLINLANNLMKK